MTGPAPLVPFLLAALSTILLVPLARAVAPTAGFVAHPRADRIHRIPTPLLGGAACLAGVAAGFAAMLLLSGRGGVSTAGILGAGAAAGRAGAGAGPFPFGAVWAGALALFCLGLWDDRRPLRASVKGVAEGVILLGVVLLWRPEGCFASVLARALLWLAGMILLNAWNYIDHTDGLFALNALAAAAILAVTGGRLSLDARVVGLLAALAGACAGFLIWNRPPARIFLGDAGSLSLGFMLFAAAAWCVDRGLVSALPGALGAHGVVLADFLLVSGSRWSRGTNIFIGGCEHSGHRLTARLGGGAALLVFAAVDLLFGSIALWGVSSRPAVATGLSVLLVLGLAIAASRMPPPVAPS